MTSRSTLAAGEYQISLHGLPCNYLPMTYRTAFNIKIKIIIMFHLKQINKNINLL
jgi:hypothetical protein